MFSRSAWSLVGLPRSLRLLLAEWKLSVAASPLLAGSKQQQSMRACCANATPDWVCEEATSFGTHLDDIRIDPDQCMCASVAW